MLPLTTCVPGDPRSAEVAFEGLQKMEGYLRSQVGKAMQLRSVPLLRILRDDGAVRGGRVLDILDAALAARTVDARAEERRLLAESSGVSSDEAEPLGEYDSADDDVISIR